MVWHMVLKSSVSSSRSRTSLQALAATLFHFVWIPAATTERNILVGLVDLLDLELPHSGQENLAAGHALLSAFQHLAAGTTLSRHF